MFSMSHKKVWIWFQINTRHSLPYLVCYYCDYFLRIQPYTQDTCQYSLWVSTPLKHRIKKVSWNCSWSVYTMAIVEPNSPGLVVHICCTHAIFLYLALLFSSVMSTTSARCIVRVVDPGKLRPHSINIQASNIL